MREREREGGRASRESEREMEKKWGRRRISTILTTEPYLSQRKTIVKWMTPFQLRSFLGILVICRC